MTTRRKAANGSGSIFQRGDGRWCGAMYVTEADGRRVRRRVYGRTRKEAEAKLLDLRSQVGSGLPVTPSRLTVEGYLQEWLSTIVAQRVRPNTLAAYRLNVDKYLVPGLGKRPLGQLTAREVRLFLDRLTAQGTGARTVRYVHGTLRAALEDATREEILAKNVAKLVRPPTPAKPERHPLGVDEIRTFLKSTRGERLHAMYVVLAMLGLRRSELLGLRWEDVDFEAGTLAVRRGLHRIDGHLRVMPAKTARSRRTIPLPTTVERALRAHNRTQNDERRSLAERWPDSGFVFTTQIGTPIDPDNCSKMVRAALRRSGLRPVRMHDFRHGVVSVLLGLGVPPRTVMEIAGHTALEMTMNVYAHVTLDDKRAALDRLGDLLEEAK